MIYVTGDTHIPVDIKKLNSKMFPAQKDMRKDDFVIICGDFGGVWNNDNEEMYWRKWLDEKSFTTLFIDGNHENFDLLKEFEVVDFCGGRAHKISDSIYHLMRGEIYTIDGQRIFTLGGASSHDRMLRTEGRSWWPEELPSDAELEYARQNLEAAGWDVDYVITHCAPTSVQLIINWDYKTDKLTDFLDEIKAKINCKNWFFGHYHIDKRIDRQFYCLYNDIYKVPTD